MNYAYPFLPNNKAVLTEMLPGQIVTGQMRNRFAVLFSTLQASDPELYIHSQRVRIRARQLARLAKVSDDEAKAIEVAALFHDIGKLAIRDELLQKPSSLTPQEYEEIKMHCAYGAQMLCQLQASSRIISVVYYHHEHWNGKGYPSGLHGDAIPLGARIVAIADAYEAMISYRPYQPICTPHQAREELLHCAGTQLDPELVFRFCTTLSVTN
jgi:putative two-component system response regulator